MPLYITYLTNWLVAGVTRSYKPRSKFDNILVLVGSQGRKKSMFFQILSREPYGIPDQGAINSTDSKMALHRQPDQRDCGNRQAQWKISARGW